MPYLIHLAIHPPRFIRGGIGLRPRHSRRGKRAQFFEDDRVLDSLRAQERDLEREGR